MTQRLTVHSIHAELILANHDGPLTIENTLLWMQLFHTHRIRFHTPLLSDRPGVTGLAAITIGHAASVAATVWGRKKSPKNAGYWNHQYCKEGFAECVEDMPAEGCARLSQLRARLASDPRIADVAPED